MIETHVKPPANPGLNGTAIILDTTKLPDGVATLTNRGMLAKMGVQRAVVSIYANQIVTFTADTIATGSSSWRSLISEATTASTLYERNVLLYGDDIKLSIVCTTACTTWEVTCKLVPDPALAQ